MSNVEPVRHGPVRSRIAPAFVTFLVAAGAIYATAWVGLDLLRHFVMPIVAVVIGGYLAVHVYRLTGRSK